MINSISYALLALFLTAPPQTQTPDRPVYLLGPHPQVVSHWQANYRFDCGELMVSVDLVVSAGKARVSAIDLGRGPMIAKLAELNDVLGDADFRDLIVTCTRRDPLPHVMFRTYATNAEGGAEPSSISVEAVGLQPSEVALVRR